MFVFFELETNCFLSFGPTKTLCIIIITLLENLTWVYAVLQFLNKFLKHCQQIQHQYPIYYYKLLWKNIMS